MVNEKMPPREPAEFKKHSEEANEALYQDMGAVYGTKEEAEDGGKQEVAKKLEEANLEQLGHEERDKIAVKARDRINELKEDEVLLQKYMENASHYTTKFLSELKSRELRPLIVHDILNELGCENDIKTDDDLKNEFPDLDTGGLTVLIHKKLEEERKQAKNRENKSQELFSKGSTHADESAKKFE